MKFDGVSILEGSNISNMTLDSGVDFPSFPSLGELFYKLNDGVYVYNDGGTWEKVNAAPDQGSAFVDWGTITGDIEDQLDLQSALNSKLNLTGGTISGNLILGGELHGPATFVIDPAVIGNNTGTVIIKGDLQVDGTTTTINSTTLAVADKNIILADGSVNSAAADGAGITIDGASATITYAATGDKFVVNKPLELNANPTENLQAATKQYVDDAVLPDLSVSLTGTEIDLSLGTIFYKTISATTTFTVINPNIGNQVSSFILDLTNGGAYTINWFNGINWSEGIVPTLTTAGRDLIAFISIDSGSSWVGTVFGKDVK